MTKKVRIENADCNGNVLVRVRTLDRGGGSPPDNVAPDIEVTSPVILGACGVHEAYIHSGRYIVIDEIENNPLA